MIAPATRSTAVVLLVQFALEAFIYIIDVYKPFFYQQLAGLQRTLPTTTDKYDGGIAAMLLQADASQQNLAYLGHELGIDDPVRFVNPGDMDTSLWMTDKQVFHAGPDIDQNSALVLVQQVLGVLR
jgi:hypothetical protein